MTKVLELPFAKRLISVDYNDQLFGKMIAKVKTNEGKDFAIEQQIFR